MKTEAMVDKYAMDAVDFRQRLRENLEAAVERQDLDLIEAVDKFSKITLLPRDYCLTYLRAFNYKVWERAQ